MMTNRNILFFIANFLINLFLISNYTGQKLNFAYIT